MRIKNRSVPKIAFSMRRYLASTLRKINRIAFMPSFGEGQQGMFTPEGRPQEGSWRTLPMSELSMCRMNF
jgi:hypothetical protein